MKPSNQRLLNEYNQCMKFKESVRNILPKALWAALRKLKKRIKDYRLRRVLTLTRKIGLDVYPIHDFYSPLPVLSSLEKNLDRWCRTSELVGIQFSIKTMKTLFKKGLQETDLL